MNFSKKDFSQALRDAMIDHRRTSFYPTGSERAQFYKGWDAAIRAIQYIKKRQR